MGSDRQAAEISVQEEDSQRQRFGGNLAIPSPFAYFVLHVDHISHTVNNNFLPLSFKHSILVSFECMYLGVPSPIIAVTINKGQVPHKHTYMFCSTFPFYIFEACLFSLTVIWDKK